MSTNKEYSIGVQTIPSNPTLNIQFYAQITLFICFLILLFAAMRFFMLWYWKVNEIVSLLKDIKSNTEQNKNK